MKRYTVLRKHILLETPRFSVVREEVEKQDSTLSDFTYVDKPSAVAVVPIEAECAYLVEHYRYITGHSLLEVPGGRIEDGERPEAAARRELGEECSLTCGELVHMDTFFPMPSLTNEIMHVFIAKTLRYQVYDSDPSEDDIQLRKVELVRLPSLLRQDSKISPIDGFILYRILLRFYPDILRTTLERSDSNE